MKHIDIYKSIIDWYIQTDIFLSSEILYGRSVEQCIGVLILTGVSG